MPRKKTVEVGKHRWEYQKDALKYYRDILNSYDTGDVVIDEDFNEIYDLLKNHPNAEQRIGAGVASIIVDATDYGGKCFHIIREDETKENFSYSKAVKGEASFFTNFCMACRKAIEQDMINVKIEYFVDKKGFIKETSKCQETGIKITMETAHVDHRQPNTFSVIVDRFIELNSIDIEKVQYCAESQYGKVFVDKNLSEKFRDYHKNIAKLRVVIKDNNLRRAYLARVQKQKKDLHIA
jgi:hypothetical protein